MKNEKVEVRAIRTDELGAIADIYKEAFSTCGFAEEWTHETAMRKVEFLYKLQPDLFLIALCNGQIAGGIVSVVKPWWTKDYISDLDIFISMKFQGKGIGKILLKKHLEKAIRKYDIGSVETTASLRTEFPLSWYKRVGFKPVDETAYIGGNASEILQKLS